MKKRHGYWQDLLYRLFCAGFLSWILLCLFSAFEGGMELGWKQGLVLALLVTFFQLFGTLSRKQKTYAGCSLLIIVVVWIVLFGKEDIVVWIGERKNEIWILTVAAVVCGLQVLAVKYFSFKIILMITVCCCLTAAMLMKVQLQRSGVMLAILYGVLVLTEWNQRVWKKQKNENTHVFAFWVLPFLLGYLLLLCAVPVPEKPYDWRWARELYCSMEEKLTMCMENLQNAGREDLDQAAAGFSEKAVFFSSIITGQKPPIKIKLSGSDMPVCYLTGKVYDTFDGYEWTSQAVGNEPERLWDTAETISALRQYDQQKGRQYDKSIWMEAEYLFFHTAYLLAPSKILKIENQEVKTDYHYRGAELVFDKKAGYGTKYALKFCQLNMNREELCAFLQGADEKKEALWKETIEEYTGEEVTVKELDAYRRRMRAQYLKRPQLSRRAEDWLLEVTGGADTEVEKLFCIEQALGSMKYNTSPGKMTEMVRDEQTFLDEFLLDKQEGYCVHFATAFVLLARAEGFPARYVQGFCIPTGKEVTVNPGMSHAWAEVYVEGKGWIPFEPTPGYDVNRYAVQKDDQNGKRGLSYVQSPNVRTDLMEKEKKIEVPATEPGRKSYAVGRWIRYGIRGLGCVLIFCALLFGIDRIKERYRDKKRSLEDKYKLTVMQSFRILSMLGYERMPEETYQELKDRLLLSKQEEEIPVRFIETYEKILYGTLEPKEEELKECTGQKDALLLQLRKREGKKYFLCQVKLYFAK